MADQEQVELLKQDVEAWNDSIVCGQNPKIYMRGANLRDLDLRDAILRYADLTGANFSCSDLSNVKLSGADLIEANFSNANLIEADLSNTNLLRADLSNTKLLGANFSNADLTGANFSGADLIGVNSSSADCFVLDPIAANLSDANLSGANLSKLDLSKYDFSGRDLEFVDFSSSNLNRVTFLGSKFQNVIFTGACIQDWNINTETTFDDVVCDYIYLKENKQERRPLIGNFKPGEFIALVRKSLETIDLIFVYGIDWQAFFQSFQQLSFQFGNQNIGIQAIEKKGGAFVVRLETSSEADKSAIETKAKELYGEQLEVLEKQYIEKMKLQGATLELVQESLVFERQRNTQLLSMVETMANKDKIIQNFHAQVGNVAGVNEGIQQATQHNYAPEIKQNLAESAKEIQDLLSQLQKNNPTDIQTVVKQRIKTDPTFRQRLQNALKEGGVETLKVLFAPIGIPIEIVRGWIDAEGS